MLKYKGEIIGIGVADLTEVNENLDAYGIKAPIIGTWTQGRRNKSITEIEDNLIYVSSDAFEVMEGDEVTFNYNDTHTYIYINYFDLDGKYKDTKYVVTNTVSLTVPGGVGYACAVVRNDATGGITPSTVSEDCSLVVNKKTVSQKINNLTDEISRKEIELAELKTLGWTVPNSSPFNNSIKGNRLAQNVARVRFDDLESLGTFGADSHCFRFRTPTDIKKEWVVAVYIDEYKSMFPRDYAGWAAEDDKTVGLLSTYDVICVRDESCSTTDEFVAKLTGKYIYYLLASTITRQIDGGEIVENLTDQGLINKAVWHQGSINYSSGAIVASATAIYSDEIPCKQGDLISVENMENAGENIVMVYYNANGYVGKDTSKLQFTVPANATKFRANYRKASTPNSNAKVFVNNKIDKVKSTVHTIQYTTSSGSAVSLKVYGE